MDMKDIALNTLWEVEAPGGEILLFVVTEHVLEPIPAVRAIPVTDWVRLMLPGDKVIANNVDIYAAHCWLEGPVLVENLRQCLGPVEFVDTIPPDRESLTNSENVHRARFTSSLYEQHNPVFDACWQKLFTIIDEQPIPPCPADLIT